MIEQKIKIPCTDCIHQNVCNIKTHMDSIKIASTHPSITVTAECKDYLNPWKKEQENDK